MQVQRCEERAPGLGLGLEPRATERNCHTDVIHAEFPAAYECPTLRGREDVQTQYQINTVRIRIQHRGMAWRATPDAEMR